MSEFIQRYAKLSRSQKQTVRKDMEAKALDMLSPAFKFKATQRQCRAAAKKKVDMALAKLRRGA